MIFFKWISEKLYFWRKEKVRLIGLVDSKLGYDFTWEFPDKKITEKVIFYSSSDSGYFSSPAGYGEFTVEEWEDRGWKTLKEK